MEIIEVRQLNITCFRVQLAVTLILASSNILHRITLIILSVPLELILCIKQLLYIIAVNSFRVSLFSM